MNEARQYLELKGLDATYWGKKTIAAEKRGYFTESNVDQAGEGVTCACGRAASDIPRTVVEGSTRYPIDPHLQRLGSRFHLFVMGNQILKASETLVAIEARALIVAKEHQQE